MSKEKNFTIEQIGQSVDREYIEIYPVNWRTVDQEFVSDLFTSESHERLNEISIYVHVPFCPVLCPFCKFNICEYDNLLYKDFATAINREVSLFRDHPDVRGRKVTAVYFGGGTGSMLRPNEAQSFLDTIAGIFQIDDGVEITMEGHPNTFSERRFREFKEAGINRVSIGIQSFQDKNLQEIGRNHSAERNFRVLVAALNTGFRSIAIDLMYRLPNQDFDNLDYDLKMIERLQPDSVSAYSLEPEATELEVKLPLMPEDKQDQEMFYYVGDFLEGIGLRRYMQPDFAKSGKESRYVVNAWRAPQQLMLGIGPGAHTHYFGGHVWANVYPVEAYINAVNKGLPPAVMGTEVTPRELMSKYMVLGVRSLQIKKQPFENLFGAEVRNIFGREIALLKDAGWLEETEAYYQLSRNGIYFVDNISKVFYSSDNEGEIQPWGKNLYTHIPKRFYEPPTNTRQE